MRSAHERQGATALVDGDHLADVRKPRQLPECPASPHDQHQQRQDRHRLAQRGSDRDHGHHGGTEHHDAFVAEARHGDTARNVEEHQAEAAHSDHETGHSGRGAEFESEEGDDGKDGALTDREEQRRHIHAEGQGA